MGTKGTKTREYICREAYNLFAEKGFKDVTMADICVRTNLSRGGLYRHYQSTEEIFLEIMGALMEHQGNEFEEKMSQNIPADEILDEVLCRYEKEMLDAEASLSVALYEFFSNPIIQKSNHSIQEQYLLSRKMWKDFIAYGVRRNEFQKVPGEDVIDLILFSYQGVRMYSRLMPVDPLIPQKITRQIRLLLTGKES